MSKPCMVGGTLLCAQPVTMHVLIVSRDSSPGWDQWIPPANFEQPALPTRPPSLPHAHLCLDPSGLDFFFHMFFLVKYSKSLEEGSFRNRAADFLWMLLFGAAILVGGGAGRKQRQGCGRGMHVLASCCESVARCSMFHSAASLIGVACSDAACHASGAPLTCP